MPNRKLSKRIKELKGTHRPDREKKETPVPTETLGSAPDHMTDMEKVIWDEISAKLPERTASAADSLSFELLVSLMARFRTGSLTGGETTLLMRSFSKFGLTPQDRGSIEPIPKPRGPSKWDQFK